MKARSVRREFLVRRAGAEWEQPPGLPAHPEPLAQRVLPEPPAREAPVGRLEILHGQDPYPARPELRGPQVLRGPPVP